MDNLFWSLVFFAGVVFSVDAVYEDVQYRKERKLELNRRFYPLDFERADAFHIMKDADDSAEFDAYNVFSSHNFLRYKITKRLNHKKLFKNEWIISDIRDQSELAFICIGSLFHKHFVQFPMINKYLNHHQEPSTSQQVQQTQQSALSPEFSTNFASSRLGVNSYVAPYIDSSLAQNRSITRSDLGALESIQVNEDLHRYESRKLSKIYLRVNKSSRVSNFKVSKNSMLYSWRSNGYLEKHSKNILDASSERIGMVRFNNKSGDDYWVYINDERIDPLIAITSAFLHQKLALWNYKKLTSS